MLMRFPGGKSRGPISRLIVETIKNKYRGGTFGEVCFGGGGITFQLLKQKCIERLIINDLDPNIMRLWRAVIKKSQYLKASIKRFEPSVDKFCAAKERVQNNLGSALDMLTVNRLSHGGRGVKGGPQGGYNQKGKYKIDCRWNPDKLCKTVEECHNLLTSIPCKCYCQDFESLLDFDLIYIDPPYYEVGNTLYLCGFTEEDHLRLAENLKQRNNWILSYNNHPFIKKLYQSYEQIVTSVAGNGGMKTNSELLILS